MANQFYNNIDTPFVVIDGTQYRAIEWSMSFEEFLKYNEGKEIYVYDHAAEIKSGLFNEKSKTVVLGFAIDKK
jgi:hypothetical protein